MNPPAGQTVDYLRLSVTDRCNYRCVYCMPPEGVPFKPHEEILSYEDMAFFVRGGGRSWASPRCGSPAASRWCARACPTWCGMIRAIPEIRDISLTTNGVLLPRFAEDAQGRRASTG